MAEVKLSMEEWHNVVKNLNKLLHLLHDALRERDSFRKQRDKLINDMAEVKRASLFDEIEGLVSKTKSSEDLGECVLQLLIENKEADH